VFRQLRSGLFSRASVLGGIRQQMDPDQTQQRAISVCGGQKVRICVDWRLLVVQTQLCPTSDTNRFMSTTASANGLLSQARKAQESIDEPTHLSATVADDPQQTPAFFIKGRRGVLPRVSCQNLRLRAAASAVMETE
jgi:hypothetical protein